MTYAVLCLCSRCFVRDRVLAQLPSTLHGVTMLLFVLSKFHTPARPLESLTTCICDSVLVCHRCCLAKPALPLARNIHSSLISSSKQGLVLSAAAEQQGLAGRSNRSVKCCRTRADAGSCTAMDIIGAYSGEASDHDEAAPDTLAAPSAIVNAAPEVTAVPQGTHATRGCGVVMMLPWRFPHDINTFSLCAQVDSTSYALVDNRAVAASSVQHLQNAAARKTYYNLPLEQMHAPALGGLLTLPFGLAPSARAASCAVKRWKVHK